MDTASGTTLNVIDETVPPKMPIGFSFCFYGAVYDSIRIYSNGYATFTYSANWPNPSGPLPITLPCNFIAFPWQDLNVNYYGRISYALLGAAPFRRFVVTFDSVAQEPCYTEYFTGQLKIFETTNIIETHILKQQPCSAKNATHAVNNLQGTDATVVGGRDVTSGWGWNTVNEGVRFNPLCDVCMGSGLAEIEHLPFVISPNPGTGQYLISWKKPVPRFRIEIRNIAGELLSETLNNETIDLGRETSGLYFYTVYVAENIYSGKLIKLN